MSEIEEGHEAFNPNIHEVNEHGDPVRLESGRIRRRRNWTRLARDWKDRPFNPDIHEGTAKEPLLDRNGFIQMRRRDEKRAPMGSEQRLEALVAKYGRKGYTNYFMKDTGARMEQFLHHDWKVVTDPETGEPVKVRTDKGSGPEATSFLMEKPEEWYEADQEKKVERTEAKVQPETAVDPTAGEYTPRGYEPGTQRRPFEEGREPPLR